MIIDNSKFVNSATEDTEKYLVRKIEKYYLTVSEMGRSRGKLTCPFCNFVNDVYIWSIAGSGKRCENCKVKLTSGNAYAEKSKFKFFNI